MEEKYLSLHKLLYFRLNDTYQRIGESTRNYILSLKGDNNNLEFTSGFEEKKKYIAFTVHAILSKMECEK